MTGIGLSIHMTGAWAGETKTAGFLPASLSWPFCLEVPHQELRVAKHLTWKTPERATVQEKLAEAT